MSNGKIMVTGGAGFIGSHVVDMFLDKGFKVVVLDNFTTGTRPNLAGALDQYPESLYIEEADIRDAAEVEHVFMKRADSGPFDCVVHLAAHVSVPASMHNPIFDAECNVIGTLNMILAAKKYAVPAFIFSSSAAVYGTPNATVVSEEHPTHPEAPYGISKLAGEMYLKVYKDSRIKIVIFRFGNVYGERQSVGSTEGAFIPRIITNIKEQAESELRGYGTPIRDFVYVKDIARAVYLALGSPSGTYNLATNAGHSVAEVWSSVAAAMQERGFTVHDPQRVPLLPGEIEKMILSTDKARAQLGWQAQMPLQQGIDNTVAYYVSRK